MQIVNINFSARIYYTVPHTYVYVCMHGRVRICLSAYMLAYVFNKVEFDVILLKLERVLLIRFKF